MNWTWLFTGSMAIALLYLKFAPKPLRVKTKIDKFMNLVLRWFHSLSWFFIALFCLTQMFSIRYLNKLSYVFIIIGGMLYFLFLGVFIFNRFSRKRE
jgi:hypothetical protein